MRAAIALMIVLAVAAASGQTTTESWHGTWTLNLSKSTYNASPAPKSGTSRLRPAAGGAMLLVQEQVTEEKGVVTSTTLTVVSSDGNTRTSTTVAVNAGGRTVANIAVYDRAR